MTDENTNNQPLTPLEGQVSEGLVETEDYDKLSNEALEALVKTGVKPAPVVPAEPVKEGEEPPPAEPTEELPDYIKGKTAEELAKDYVNLRKKLDEQGKEVGELRKFKEDAIDLDTQMKQYQIDATSRRIVETEIKGMTDAEKQQFYDVFSEDPVKALMPYISKAIKPIAVVQARQANENEINRLIEANKDGLVPYDRKAVDKIIAGFTGADGRNKLFEIPGTTAFEEGYKIYRDKNLPEALQKKEQTIIEKAEKEAEEKAQKKLRTYTEPQGIRSAPSGSTDYDTMPMEQLGKLVGKPKD